MAHNLEIHDNGQAAFVSARVDAWHQLGTVLPSAFTANDALEHGLLGGWNVRKAPIQAQLPDGRHIDVPGRAAVIRDNPVTPGQIDVLGDVGDAYHVIQNEELAGLLDTLVDESGAHFETAGAIDGGRRIFITMKLPGHIKVGGVDRIDNYLAAMTSHDGSMATTLMVTPVRIVCQNTMNAAYGNHKTSFRIRHTSGAQRAIVSEAREALEFSFDYLDEFQDEASKMINSTMSLNQFEEIITREFGAPEDAPQPTITRTENKLDEMLELFADADTHSRVRDTVWAGYNALVEWQDHFSPVRGGDVADEVARAKNTIQNNRFKERARRLMLSYV